MTGVLLQTLLVATLCGEIPRASQTQSDLVRAYLDFESEYYGREREPGERTAAATEFDAISKIFLRGGLAEASKRLRHLTATFRAPASPKCDELPTLKVVMKPQVYVREESPEPTASLVALDSVVGELPESVDLHFVPVDTSGLSHKVVLDTTSVVAEAPLIEVVRRMRVGAYRMHLSCADGHAFPMGYWYVVDESFDALRRRVVGSLEPLASGAEQYTCFDSAMQERDGARFRHAAAIGVSRASLLTDHPAHGTAAQFLEDQLALAGEVLKESGQLVRGIVPYTNRVGTYWRVVPGDRPIPMVVHVPEAVGKQTAKSWPLVIALHGAGGNERMFIDGYGQGGIRRLADRHGFIVACPSTPHFMQGGQPLSRTIDSLRQHYSIDPQQIHLIGHSLGAMAADRLVQTHGSRLTSAACIAGRGPDASPRGCPTLVVIANDDGLLSATRSIDRVQSAIDAGLPITLRTTTGYGHTLVVEHVLPDVIEWALSRPRRERSTADPVMTIPFDIDKLTDDQRRIIREGHEADASLNLVRSRPVLFQIVGTGNDANETRGPTRIDHAVDVLIYGLSEAADEQLVDYGWLQNADTGTRVWEMTSHNTIHAGGAAVNRKRASRLTLSPGSYSLHYVSNATHAFSAWTGAAPEHANLYGVTVFNLTALPDIEKRLKSEGVPALRTSLGGGR
jgi:hypothetical protein